LTSIRTFYFLRIIIVPFTCGCWRRNILPEGARRMSGCCWRCRKEPWKVHFRKHRKRPRGSPIRRQHFQFEPKFPAKQTCLVKRPRLARAYLNGPGAWRSSTLSASSPASKYVVRTYPLFAAVREWTSAVSAHRNVWRFSCVRPRLQRAIVASLKAEICERCPHRLGCENTGIESYIVYPGSPTPFDT